MLRPFSGLRYAVGGSTPATNLAAVGGSAPAAKSAAACCTSLRALRFLKPQKSRIIGNRSTVNRLLNDSPGRSDRQCQNADRVSHEGV